ncbi:SAF domain-containing protein [Blastococcus sp. PRF04-17]|uniref:SAF domain-containing protein n=1 Tax=Blastococcus sp. PRF04-17 TaxID=2933797 RepID=UPI001FF33E05|nr:SAF domain-containing protein [Blastococcus sp. PRF04-17]UOY01266.1 SAF domain-containing protein [Blastococcus sp. PRF04-17]
MSVAVTAVRPSGAPTAGQEVPASPVPRRVRPPRWLDLRLGLGVLLVLGSVLLGARVVSAADATVPVWAAAGDLAPGTELTSADLVSVDVRLDRAAEAYLSAGTRPEGRMLSRAVRAGELLPRTALEEPDELVQIALPVQAGFVPPGLRRGQLVDVFAVADPAAGATGVADGSVRTVVRMAPVQAISGRSEGVLSTPSTTVQVVVAVAAGDAAGLLASIGGRPLVVVVHGSVDVGASDRGVVGDPPGGTAGEDSATEQEPAD